MRFITGGRSTPREEIAGETLPGIFEVYERAGGFGIWAAIEKASGEFVGWFGLHPPKDRNPDGGTDEVELGYRLKKSAWGKGYATEGSRALVEQGLSGLGVKRVFAQTMTVNTASRRVMEKCGLKFVKTFFDEWPEYIEGAEHGDVEYALTREDWEKPNV